MTAKESEYKKLIEPYIHRITDVNENKWEVIEVSDLEDIVIHIAEQAVGGRIKFYEELTEEEVDEDGKEDQIMIWTAKIFAIKDLLTQIKTLIEE